MTREDKELLFKDLSARLYYGIYFYFEKTSEIFRLSSIKVDHMFPLNDFEVLLNGKFLIQWCKPYLRPMSSMTEEEFNEFEETFGFPLHAEFNMITKKTIVYNSIEIDRGYAVELDIDGVALMLDWLNKNMFDYRGLIEKDLAIKVTEENNPYKK